MSTIALLHDENGIPVERFDDYDMGDRPGIYPKITERGFYLKERIVLRDGQVLHFEKGFDGYPTRGH